MATWSFSSLRLKPETDVAVAERGGEAWALVAVAGALLVGAAAVASAAGAAEED